MSWRVQTLACAQDWDDIPRRVVGVVAGELDYELVGGDPV